MINTIFHLVQHAYASFTSCVFYEDAFGHILFEELPSRLNSVRECLHKHRVKPGSTVSYTLDLNYHSVPVILALFSYGFRVVPIYPETSQEVFNEIQAQTQSSLHIYDPLIKTRYSINDVDLPIYPCVAINSLCQYSDHQNSESLLKLSLPAEDSTAAVIFSSGTTGMPKGICLSQSAFVNGANLVSQYLRINSNDTILSPLRPNFDYGLNQLFCCLLTGATLIGFNMRNPGIFPSCIQRFRPTIIPLMPAIIDILSSPVLSRAISSQPSITNSVRLVCSSGGKLFPAQLKWLETIFSQAWVCPMYGLTEAFRSTYVPHVDYHSKKESIGIPIPTVHLGIIGDNDELLSPGQIGELVHFGGVQSQGYLNNPKDTSSRFRPLLTNPDWPVVRSGDLAFMDADGFFFHIGRIDEQMKIFGIRVSPTEVENALLNFASIQRAVCFGSDPQSGPQQIYTCLVTDTNFQHDIFYSYVCNELPAHYRPTSYLTLTEFPYTGNGGKIDRAGLKNIFYSSQSVVNF